MGYRGSVGTTLRSAYARFWADTTGATAIEYALIAASISIAIAAVVTQVGSTLRVMYFQEVSSGLK